MNAAIPGRFAEAFAAAGLNALVRSDFRAGFREMFDADRLARFNEHLGG